MSAERSPGLFIKLNKEPIIEYLTSNIVLLLKWMIAGWATVTLERRIRGMENGYDPQLLEAESTRGDRHRDPAISKSQSLLCRTIRTTRVRCSRRARRSTKCSFVRTTNIGHFRAAGKLLDNHKGQLPTRRG